MGDRVPKQTGKRKTPTKPGLRFGEVLGFAWGTIREDLWVVLIVWGVAWFIVRLQLHVSPLIFPSVKATHPPHGHPGLLVLLSSLRPLADLIAFHGWNALTGVLLTKVSLLLTAKERVSFGVIGRAYRLFFIYLVVCLLWHIIATLGLVLFIIPGVIWGVRYTLAPYLVIDRGLSPVKALRASRAMTKRAWWTFFSLWLLFLPGLLVYWMLVRCHVPGLYCDLVSAVISGFFASSLFHIGLARLYHLLATPDVIGQRAES
jgi:hypothetical protein